MEHLLPERWWKLEYLDGRVRWRGDLPYELYDRESLADLVVIGVRGNEMFRVRVGGGRRFVCRRRFSATFPLPAPPPDYDPIQRLTFIVGWVKEGVATLFYINKDGKLFRKFEGPFTEAGVKFTPAELGFDPSEFQKGGLQ